MLVVLVTTPTLRVARKIAAAALAERLIACANLLPGIESHYRWQGKTEKSSEVLLLLKTTSARLADLERLIVAKHPYDTPEIVALPVHRVNGKFQAWWLVSLQ